MISRRKFKMPCLTHAGHPSDRVTDSHTGRIHTHAAIYRCWTTSIPAKCCCPVWVESVSDGHTIVADDAGGEAVASCNEPPVAAVSEAKRPPLRPEYQQLKWGILEPMSTPNAGQLLAQKSSQNRFPRQNLMEFTKRDPTRFEKAEQDKTSAESGRKDKAN